MTGGRVPKTFCQIRKQALHASKCFLRKVEKMAVGYSVHIDYSKGESAGRLVGLFTENGLLGMLEACHYDSVDVVFTFLGSL